MLKLKILIFCLFLCSCSYEDATKTDNTINSIFSFSCEKVYSSFWTGYIIRCENKDDICYLTSQKAVLNCRKK